MFVFHNGQFVEEEKAVVSIFDRGFLYGDGLFETMRVVNGKPFRGAQHLERMVRGADFLKIKLPFPPKGLHQFAEQLVEKNGMPDCVLRVTLTRGVGERGYSPKGAESPSLVMALHPAPEPAAIEPPACRLITASIRISADDPLAQFKTCNKLPQIVARAEAEAKDADDALIVNTSGEVVETAGANLFWIYYDRVCTTPTGRGALPGITRAVVLEICQVLGLTTNKRVIKAESLRHSEGLFLTQSAQGVVPVATLDGEPVKPSPLVEKIYRAYGEMLAKS
jgi:branched-chain amino acid aminotransferase